MSGMKTGGQKSHLQSKWGLPDALIRNYERLCLLMTASWWTRTWTFQEYVLAQDFIFLCEDTIVTDAQLIEYIDRYAALNLASVEVLISPVRFRHTFTMQYTDDEDCFKEEWSRLKGPDAKIALLQLQSIRSELTIRHTDEGAKLKSDIHALTYIDLRSVLYSCS